jgi:hypothetical protein
MPNNSRPSAEWTDDDRDIRNFLGLMASVAWSIVGVTYLTVHDYNHFVFSAVGIAAIVLTFGFVFWRQLKPHVGHVYYHWLARIASDPRIHLLIVWSLIVWLWAFWLVGQFRDVMQGDPRMATVAFVFVAFATCAALALSIFVVLAKRPIAVEIQAPMVPMVGLTVREVKMDALDPNPARHYPRKLNLHLSNDGDDIHLGAATWIKSQVGLQTGKPAKIVYLLKSKPGPSEQFDLEYADNVIVHSNRWLKIWIGLDSSISDSKLVPLTKDRQLGVLEIPARISGIAMKIRIPL